MAELTAPFIDYMARGGDVLWGILFVTILLWCVIIERLWYLYYEYPSALRDRVEIWSNRQDHSSWYALYQRRQLISETECLMLKNMKIIPTFIALLPLLGLLGTVTGMIQVFEVMANLGTGNPRAMANGVSAATIPTMSGMLVAIAAIPFWTWVDRRHKTEVNRLQELISLD